MAAGRSPANSGPAATAGIARFTSTSLAFRGHCLMARSRRRALPWESARSIQARVTGRRLLVYRAPRPALCAASRATGSVAIPV